MAAFNRWFFLYREAPLLCLLIFGVAYDAGLVTGPRYGNWGSDIKDFFKRKCLIFANVCITLEFLPEAT